MKPTALVSYRSTCPCHLYTLLPQSSSYFSAILSSFALPRTCQLAPQVCHHALLPLANHYYPDRSYHKPTTSASKPSIRARAAIDPYLHPSLCRSQPHPPTIQLLASKVRVFFFLLCFCCQMKKGLDSIVNSKKKKKKRQNKIEDRVGEEK